MIPRITIGLILFVAAAYIAGARWPGLANKIGLA